MKFAIIITICLSVCRAHSQLSDSASLSYTRLGIVGGFTVGGFVVGHGVLNNLWWKGNRVDFHVNSDLDYKYALNADKLGHATFTYFASSSHWIGTCRASMASHRGYAM